MKRGKLTAAALAVAAFAGGHSGVVFSGASGGGYPAAPGKRPSGVAQAKRQARKRRAVRK